MRSYRDFDLEIGEPQRDEAGGESLLVRVAASPAGEQRRAEAARVAFGPELRQECGRLERRELDLAGLVALGGRLGELLLPEPARRYFERCRAALDEGEGLRLRLKLDTWGVADLPWEFAWLAPGGGAAAPPGAAGFLALDPRLSIVRYELLAEPLGTLEPTGRKKLRVVALLAAPRDPRWAPLDLEGEARGLRAALAPRREIALEVVETATLASLERALLDGAQVFHFAGHGRFQAAPEEKIDTVAGRGFLVFCEEDGRAREVPAETVLVNLRGRDVRLAVLGACEGARRDRVNPWTGIAPALIRGGLPAAVAMQATLYDRSAVAFSTRFYEALAQGLPVDAAVSAGRIAIFNAGGPGERDWGVPVLYLRADSGVLFPRPAGESAGESIEPLGRRGWANAALATLALAAAAAAFHAYVQPRFASRWLWGAGLSFATVGGLALAWLQWLAGDEARAWVRRSLRRPRATWAVGAAALLLAGAAAWVAAHRPAVLRVVPGTKLTARLLRPGVVHTLRIWQGEGEAEPTWVVRPFTTSGAAVGASDRVLRLALSRSRAQLEGAMRSYLEERVPCPEETPEACERKRDGWMARWWLAEPQPDGSAGPRRRRDRPLRFELLRDREVDGEAVDLLPNEVRLHEEVEDDVELLFVEPAPNP